ncbi:carotenoid oxygenase family protein [Nocardia sp. BSTN01]|uniref:carotenoid oxygenase family protein n=1 Tax=Nocardia sp. BSTN01 TaxID=2783665 RepID=UPI00188F3FED|nr:carotenoid oxygenase family protein [Nocardia sp. BSTN01]MBF4998053.1 carotenoid oxygenase family protein [Nocardia sp. BSTN01]
MTDVIKHSAQEPAVGEFDDVVVNDVAGVIPPELSGTLYRNGPVRWEAGGFYAQHLFDGDGMIAKFVFDKGELHYRNRYVRTPKYRAEERGRGMRIRGMGTNAPGGVLRNAARIPKDRANTHAIYHAEKLLALTDDGRPWRIDPGSLATLGRENFRGRLPLWSTFSPHPKLDPRTGEMFNFGLTIPRVPRPGALAALRCYRIDRSGRLSTIRTVPLPRIFINHDFGLTENHFVFLIDPLHVKHPIQFGLGLLDANAATVHESELGTLVLLVPRDGGKPRMFVADTIAKAHVNNAYEIGGEVIIDLVRYDDWNELSAMLCGFREYEKLTGGIPSRVRITPSDTLIVEDRTDLLAEFPMHDWRRTTQDYRYSYLVHGDGSRAGIIKLDNHSGRTWLHEFAERDFPGEPVFVPRETTTAEDDGWLLVVNYDGTRHRTAVVILDARDMEAEPVAVATLPHHFMPGFHGMFTGEIREAGHPG